MNYNEIFKSLLHSYFCYGRSEFLESVYRYFLLGEHETHEDAKFIQGQAELWLNSFLDQSGEMWLAGQGYVKHEVPSHITGYQVRTDLPYRADTQSMPLYCWFIRIGYHTVNHGFCFTQDIWVKRPFQVSWRKGNALDPSECKIS